MTLEPRHLVAIRQCCGARMDTYKLYNEHLTQRHVVEYECGECGRRFYDADEAPLTLQLRVTK